MARSISRRRIGAFTVFSVSSLFVFFTGLSSVGNADVSFSSEAPAPLVRFDTADLESVSVKSVNRRPAAANFVYEKDLQGEYTYIVRLADDAVATYKGGVPGLARTSAEGANRSASSSLKLDTKRAEVQAYARYLETKQATFTNRLASQIGRSANRLYGYTYAFNGVALELTQDEAARAAALPGVLSVTRNRIDHIETNNSVPLIGAFGIWDGSFTNGVSAMGEGMLVGILDTGVNLEFSEPDNPMFADPAPDGYVHTNPYGDGVFVGECADYPGLCNNKVIGCHPFVTGGDSLTQPGDPICKDTDGHGSHVGSTVAGNILADFAFPDAEGNPSGVVLDQISGVAPHANLIAYKVCAPGCGGADIIAAIDQAIVDGVDVLNHSISSASGSPWADPKSVAFLGARAAGIMLHNSAGNTDGTLTTADYTGNAPWATSVAATTHDRSWGEKTLSNLSGGGTTPPGTIFGAGVTPGFTGDIVYAGDFVNPNDPTGDSAQCLQPFPAGTFLLTQIVLCDRGAIARVQKAINVRDGGAGGFILANVEGGDTFLADDAHVIPGIQIAHEDGDVLKLWLASESNHTGTISATEGVSNDPSVADWQAGFSAQGPVPNGLNYLAPAIAAPGVDILAAGSGIDFDNPDASVAAQFGAISGTSMSSPHGTGSSVLIKQLHPEWTPAEVLSAIMTTGKTEGMLLNDGATPATSFMHGGGRVQLMYAANAGLLLDESSENFETADPALGGDPSTLNLAGLRQDACLGSCTWTRTVKATVADTWTVSANSDADLSLSVEPASFSLDAGQAQTLSITATVSGAELDVWQFGSLVMTPASADVPPTVIQAQVQATGGILPEKININAYRDKGSWLQGGMQTLEITDLQINPVGLSRGDVTTVAITGQTGTFDPYTPAVGVEVIFTDVPQDALRLVVRTFDSESPDADLFIGRDDNGDGQISQDEERCNSGTSTSFELCDVMNPEAGSWWIAVINFAASTPTATDNTTVQAAAVATNNTNFSAEGPTAVPSFQEFGVRMFWNETMEEGDILYGVIQLGPNADDRTGIGTIPVDVVRQPDDVAIRLSSDTANPGDTLTYTMDVIGNQSFEDKNYTITAEVPDGLTLVDGSVTGGGAVTGNTIEWNLEQSALLAVAREYMLSTSLDDPACDTGFGGYVDLESLDIFPDTSISGDTIEFTAFASGPPINYYGLEHTGISFTDDGFGFLSSTSGATPFVNAPIPSADDPNNTVAMFWHDLEVVADGAPGRVRGVSLAAAGDAVILAEFDDVEPWPAGDTENRYDFQVVMTRSVDDTPGAYEVVFAYDNLVGDLPDVLTVGVENGDGTDGTEYIYNDASADNLSDGLIVCFDFSGASGEPITVSYDVTVDAGASGSIGTTVTDSVDTPGTETVVREAVVGVGQADDSDGDGYGDAEDNCVLVANPSQCDSNADQIGNHCDADLNESGWVNYADLAVFIADWGSTTSGEGNYGIADLNCDSMVDFDDLEIFRALFNQPPGPSGLVQ